MSHQTAYRDALSPGTELFGYTIRGVLGRGGFGTTYHATDRLDQSFALKEHFPRQFAIREGGQIIASSPQDEELFKGSLDRFLAEAKILSLLGRTSADTGIVRVITFFEAKGTAYIVMECLAGAPLDAMLKCFPGGLPADLLEDCMRRVLRALDVVHRAGLMHRDLKPSNIFMRDNRWPVLIDFGSARQVVYNNDSDYTQIFSGGYAPIEQFSGTRQGPYSDIYAVGAVCYRAIGGHLVDASTRDGALLEDRPDPLEPARAVGAGRYPATLLRAIDCALAVRPEQRPQTALELLALLGGAPAASTVLRQPARAVPAKRRPELWRNQAVLITAAVAAIVIVAGGVFISQRHFGNGEMREWATVLSHPSADGFHAFLQHFPSSEYHADAEARLAALELGDTLAAEAEAWNKVKDTASAAIIEAFLTNYPDGPNAANAKARLVVLTADHTGD